MMREEEGGPKKLDRNKHAAPRSNTSTIPGAAPRVIPGMTAAAPKKLSKSACKKNAQEAVEAKAAVDEAIAKLAGTTSEAPTEMSPVELSPEEKAKKVKSLLKKLKQIDAIKAKKMSGDVLNDDQLHKLETKQGLRDKVAQLSA
ncbi:unnamed protein product [Hyaloperonospora brassicae]|uniref:WHEP-TRS domain-containing protein n=1 Tax=Hyaloperonospora brassicae TaxID=162125 RepID=A0AAV0TM45_HYABA|nr:unnamed protein product [Hyaloperonospora brassicae]